MKAEIITAIDVAETCKDLGLQIPTGIMIVQTFPEGCTNPRPSIEIDMGSVETKPKPE